MNYFEIQRGATSQMVEFDVFDSSSAVGARLAGLVYNSGSLTAYYNRQNAANAATAMALVTMTKGTWVSLGFIAVDATNMPGVYQLCLPDAAIAAAAGVNFVTVVIRGAANMVPVVLSIRLTNWVASTAPANALDVSATGEAGLDFDNVKNSTGAKQIGTILAADQAVNVTKVNATAQTAGDLAAMITVVDDYVDTEVAAIVSELAKVPKSDSTVSWNATALAAIGLAVLNQGLATSDADALNARTVRSALRALRNKITITANTLTVTKENDTDSAWTAALTTDAVAAPIIVVDPT